MTDINERETQAVEKARTHLVSCLEKHLDEIENEDETPDVEDLEEVAMLSAAISLARIGFNDPAAALNQFGIKIE